MEPVVTNHSSKKTVKKKGATRGLSPFAIARQKFYHNKVAMISFIYLSIIILISFISPYFLPSLDHINKVNPMLISHSPTSQYWLGTDEAGRDVFSRLLYGGRTSLFISISITISLTLMGTIIGAIAGYFGTIIDSILMRFTDFIMNFPFLLFVIVLSTILPGTGAGTLIITISILGWTGFARMVRGKVMAEKENEYVLSAVATGGKPLKIILKHIVPNVLSTIIVQATLILASMIVVETALSFIGFGVPQTTPTWGNLLQSARNPDVLTNKLWIWLPPAFAIVSTILSINFIGEGLKDAFNPKSQR